MSDAAAPRADLVEVCGELLADASREAWRALWHRYDTALLVLKGLGADLETPGEGEERFRQACTNAGTSWRTVRTWAQRAAAIPAELRDPTVSVREHFKRLNAEASL